MAYRILIVDDEPQAMRRTAPCPAPRPSNGCGPPRRTPCCWT